MNNRQEILNELEAISTILFKQKENEKSVVIPENYFKELADIIVFQTKNETSILSSINKEKIEVPANYFDTFGDAILSKINHEEKSTSDAKSIALPKQPNKLFQLFSRVAIAASIVGAVFFAKQIVQPKLPVNNCADGIACLTQNEIYNYMNTNSQDFEVQEVQETVQTTLEKTEIKIDIDKKEALQYLEENKIILESDDALTDIF